MSCLSSARQGSIFRHCATTQRYPLLVPVVYVQLKTRRGKTFASCSEQPRDGMVIYTNSGRVKKYRKLIVELLLAAHCRDCTTCVKSGECVLQELAHRLGVQTIRFKIPGNIMSWIQVLLLWFVIQTNVFCVVTAYVPAKNFRESEL